MSGPVPRTQAEASGIDPETWALLEAMPCPNFGDVHACTCRPGSWEWQRPEAEAMRELLATRGFASSPVPDVPWRVRWARMEIR